MITINSITPWSAKRNFMTFNGKTEDFWKAYNKKYDDKPLKETIKESINDNEKLLGEGFSKKGYDLGKLDKYIIRVYKRDFQESDLDKEFEKPKRTYLNTVDNVILCVPNKIDIVKKKFGEKLGVEKYGVRICPPLSNIKVTRDETVKILEIYEKLQDFPLSAFTNATRQIIQFSRKKGYQFDIVNPNNIFIDTKKQTINFIDPMDPKLNKCEKNPIKFSKYHGRDSLYPILCDFIMQKEHLNNLSAEEQNRWKNATQKIIAKCILAGNELNLPENNENMRFLYNRINQLWDTLVLERYDEFRKDYINVIEFTNTIAEAINHKNAENIRIDAISKLNSSNFNNLKPIFEKLIIAPHQPKVEIPEILNATLDKIAEYGENAKDITPVLETLFNKEIFYPTKLRLYNIFLNINPNNKKFLEEIEKTANNQFEKTLYLSQINQLKSLTDKLTNDNYIKAEQIYEKANSGDKIPKKIVNKLWMSRTCVNTGIEQKIALQNMKEAYNFMESLNGAIPKIEDLITFHKLSMKNTPNQEQIVGLIRSEENNYLFNKIFNVKKIPKNAINPYADSGDVPNELKKLNDFINENYDKKDPFDLTAEVFFKLTWIHPFYNGNGRATRLFTEALLQSKGYELTKWPEEALYRKIVTAKQLAESLRQNSIKN